MTSVRIIREFLGASFISSGPCGHTRRGSADPWRSCPACCRVGFRGRDGRDCSTADCRNGGALRVPRGSAHWQVPRQDDGPYTACLDISGDRSPRDLFRRATDGRHLVRLRAENAGRTRPARDGGVANSRNDSYKPVVSAGRDGRPCRSFRRCGYTGSAFGASNSECHASGGCNHAGASTCQLYHGDGQNAG